MMKEEYMTNTRKTNSVARNFYTISEVAMEIQGSTHTVESWLKQAAIGSIPLYIPVPNNVQLDIKNSTTGETIPIKLILPPTHFQISPYTCSQLIGNPFTYANEFPSAIRTLSDYTMRGRSYSFVQLLPEERYVNELNSRNTLGTKANTSDYRIIPRNWNIWLVSNMTLRIDSHYILITKDHLNKVLGIDFEEYMLSKRKQVVINKDYHRSANLIYLEEAASIFWNHKNITRGDRETYPKSAEVVAWLQAQGFSERSAKAGAAIITPAFAVRDKQDP